MNRFLLQRACGRLGTVLLFRRPEGHPLYPEYCKTMTVRRLILGLCLLIAPALSGCLRSVEISPENAIAASDHLGNIRIEDEEGIIYIAQSIEEGEEGFYLLNMVKVIDDGVPKWETEYSLPKDRVTKIHYYQNNKWVTGTAIASASLFMVWLYYKINTTIFD